MKKNYFRVLKLSMLMVVLLSFVNTIKAQTFVCTDVSVYDTNMSEREIQKMKTDILGSIYSLEFYDNSVKVTYDKSSSLVFDKVNNSKYQCIEHKRDGRQIKVVIELQKWVAYIKLLTISGYENGKL